MSTDIMLTGARPSEGRLTHSTVVNLGANLTEPCGALVTALAPFGPGL